MDWPPVSGTGTPDSSPPRHRVKESMKSTAAYVCQLVLILAASSSVLYGWYWYRFGDRALVLPYLKGRRFFVEPAESSFGTGKVSTNRTVPVVARNLGSKKVVLLGVRTDCSCVSTETYPISIAPGETRAVPLVIHLADEPGAFEQSVVYYSDSPDNPQSRVRVSGVVVKE